MKKVRINHQLINKLIESDQILTFSYFIKLKYLYSNSTIYNFSIRKCARFLNISPNCMKLHLNKMERLGIISVIKNKNNDRGKNLTFISIEKITKMYGLSYNRKCGSIDFHLEESAQDIKTRLYSKVLINNINKQKYSIKSKSNSLMRKKDQFDKNKLNGKSPNSLQGSIASERIDFDRFICCYTVGTMFSRTKMTGYNQLMRMKKMGLFSLKRKIVPVLIDCTKEDFEYLCKYGELFKGKYFYNIKDSSIMKNVGFTIEL